MNARLKVLKIELQAVRAARLSNDLEVARAAIEREAELLAEIAKEPGSTEVDEEPAALTARSA